MLAQLTALIFNVNRGEKQRPLAASDFLPRWGAAEDQPEASQHLSPDSLRQSPERVIKILGGIFGDE